MKCNDLIHENEMNDGDSPEIDKIPVRREDYIPPIIAHESETHHIEEDTDDEIIIMTYNNEPTFSLEGKSSVVLNTESPSTSATNLSEIPTLLTSENETSSDSESDIPIRKSSRNKKKTKIFTYNELGKNPLYV